MKEFLSNSWVVSIISGILVFFVTNFFVILKSKRESRKQIYDANTMVLNHIRGYVVDNGLPSQIIIESVKKSIAREYNIKYNDLLSTKELCEELIKDIIGNIYISNDNRKIYINMLEEYLIQNNGIDDSEDEDINKKYDTRTYEYISTVISIIAGLISALGTGLITAVNNISDIVDNANTNNLTVAFCGTILIIGITIFIYFKNRKK